PPLAAAATVVAAGPGLTARLDGRHLRLTWQPETDWLHGWVTVRGPAGWADVRVTGQVAQDEPLSLSAVEEWFAGDSDGARMTVLAAPPPRPRRIAPVVVAGVVLLAVLTGAGVAYALRTRDSSPTATAPISQASASPRTSASTPTPKVPKVPLTARASSMDKPVVTGTIKVGDEPEGTAVSPDNRTVYVANQGSRVLSVVDARTRKVTDVRLRSNPRFVAVSRDGRQVFVSMYRDDKSGSGVAVIDARTRKVTRYVTTGPQPYTLSVAPDGRLWVPIHGRRRVEVYAAKDQRADGLVRVQPNPHAITFSAGTARAFTANHESNSVSIIDLRMDKLEGSVRVSRSPHSLAASPDGTKVLVAGYDADTVDLIDAGSGKRTGPIEVGDKPQSVAYARDGRHAYVVNEGDGTVSVLNGRTGRTTATIKVGRSPRTVTVSPDGRTAYVSNGDDDTISVLRIAS
ncbi:YncE family protein, partial [Actinoplanes sp. NPDC051633]|uniref:YncE family protein n=1 Tax=Actinoplanes sp. NPDC051633 TaxID=3155670 RepID=UPI003444F576